MTLLTYCRYMLMALGLCIITPVYGWHWQDMWRTSDQQAQQLMQSGQYAAAAKLFQRQDWRAIAAYQAKDYSSAARDFLLTSSVEGAYNAGNALAMMGKYPQAIAAYDEALAKAPDHQDAQYNRRLVKALLDKQKQESSQERKPSEPKSDQPQHSQQDKKQQGSAPSQPDSDAKPQQTSPEQSKSSKPDSSKQDGQSSPKPNQSNPSPSPISKARAMTQAEREQKKADEQWLQLIPDDPGGLLRQKFLRDHLKRQGEQSL